MLINPKDISTNQLVSKQNEDKNYKVGLKDKIIRLGMILISGRCKPLSEVKIDLKKISNVLILRNDGLGDYVLTTPLISLLKNINPDINIDIIASHRNAKLIEYDNNIRKIFVISHKPTLLDLLYASFKIKKYSDYDLLIAAKHTKITQTSLLFNVISKKAIKIGFKISSSRRQYTLDSYKLTFNNISNEDELKYYKILQMMLQSISSEKLLFRFPYVLNEKFTNENKKISPNNKYNNILVNISGFEKSRIFTEEKIVQIKNSIKSIYNNISIVFTSSPESYPILDSLLEKGALTQEEIGKYNIISLIQEMPKYDLVITPDTAITHFASALNIKQVIFYDIIEKYYEWSPDNNNFIALVGNGDINDIPTEELDMALNLAISDH